jgi:hypothetical protein
MCERACRFSRSHRVEDPRPQPGIGGSYVPRQGLDRGSATSSANARAAARIG